MYNYDVENFKNEGKAVYGLRSEIERIVDEVCKNGVSNVILTGIGGTIFELMSIKKIFDDYSKIDCVIMNGADMLIENPDWIDEHSVVITGSKSGDTPETIAACKYCRERGAKVISLVGTNDCPLANCSDYVVVSDIPGMTHTYLKFYLIALRFMYNNKEFDAYEKFADECRDLYESVVKIQEKFEPIAASIADKYSNEPYQIWVGSGIVWGEINLFTMCILEEMQWMRTREVTSSNFFHGTLELVEKDVPVYLIKGIGKYRPQDERVERFLEKTTDKLVVIDLENYKLDCFSKEFEEMLTPITFNALTRGRLAYHFERVTGHDLNIRRYYRQFEY